MKKASDIDIEKIDTSSEEFQNALKLLAYTSQSVFLTGKAGTGKSTFLQYLTRTTKKKHVVLAPTGIAAVNAGGQTLHSFFKLPFKPMLPTDPEVADINRLKERMKYNAEMVKMLRKIELIIIDEVSMVRADTIDIIDRLLKIYCNNYRQPFGGKQLLLVGDVFQLEPVITGDVRDVLAHAYPNGTFFFNAQAFHDLDIVPIELKQVFRQSDPTFINLLDRVRIGSPAPADIQLLNSKVDPNAQLLESDFTMTIATRRDIVDSINEEKLAQLPGASRTFTGRITQDFPENSLPTDKELTFKIGAQVVFVKNDIDKRWVNGTIGIIDNFGDDGIIVELEDGTKHCVKEETWENVKYEYDEDTKKVNEIVVGTFVQFPLKLAWALTIHKSQGLTFDRVIVDVGHGAFSGGQTYVALSRCRSLQGLKLKSTINQRDIFVNRRVVDFSRRFNDQAAIRHALESAKADDLYNRAAKAFDNDRFLDASQMLIQAIALRNDLGKPGIDRLLAHKLGIIRCLKRTNAALLERLTSYEEKFQQLASEYVEMAETCREEGWEMQAAINNYDKAISLRPDYALAWIGKGLAKAQMGNLDDAVMCLSQASKIDTADHRALYEAGRLLVNNGDISQGMDFLLQALQRNDKVPQTHLAIVEAYEKIGDEDNAAIHRAIAEKLKKNKKK